MKRNKKNKKLNPNRFLINQQGLFKCICWFNSNFKCQPDTTDYFRKFAIYLVVYNYDKLTGGYLNLRFFTLKKNPVQVKINSKTFRKSFRPIDKEKAIEWIKTERYKAIEHSKAKAIDWLNNRDDIIQQRKQYKLEKNDK